MITTYTHSAHSLRLLNCPYKGSVTGLAYVACVREKLNEGRVVSFPWLGIEPSIFATYSSINLVVYASFLLHYQGVLLYVKFNLNDLVVRRTKSKVIAKDKVGRKMCSNPVLREVLKKPRDL